MLVRAGPTTDVLPPAGRPVNGWGIDRWGVDRWGPLRSGRDPILRCSTEPVGKIPSEEGREPSSILVIHVRHSGPDLRRHRGLDVVGVEVPEILAQSTKGTPKRSFGNRMSDERMQELNFGQPRLIVFSFDRWLKVGINVQKSVDALHDRRGILPERLEPNDMELILRKPLDVSVDLFPVISFGRIMIKGSPVASFPVFFFMQCPLKIS